MEANNVKAMREAAEFALFVIRGIIDGTLARRNQSVFDCRDKLKSALSAPPHTGKWMNGRKYEYEYAYCSECGRMQWADWDTHKQAEESIGSFADKYRFCPGCGAKMEGGVYVK